MLNCEVEMQYSLLRPLLPGSLRLHKGGHNRDPGVSMVYGRYIVEMSFVLDPLVI